MNQKKKNILLGVLIVGVISMSVAFAALSTNLSINGSASIPTTKWDIHFDNGDDNTPTQHQDGKTNRGAITGVQFAATSITNFTATLNQPNDEVVYNFDIVNAGTIDGQLDNFTKTLTCNSSDCSMITYTIDCEDAQQNDANQSDYILAHGQSVSCVMKIKYNEQTNSGNGVYEQGAVNATATASWLYKQVEGNGGGGNTPTPQPTGNWDNYITPSQTSGGATLPQGSTMWIQENTQSGENEVCGVLPSGVVCLENNTDITEFVNCDKSGENCTTIGYAAQKKAELELKGAGTCEVNADAFRCEGGDGYPDFILSTNTSVVYSNYGICMIAKNDGSAVCQLY